MPLVAKRLDQGANGIFLLPRPTLSKENIKLPRARLGEMASRDRLSYPQVRSAARRTIDAQLKARGLTRLLDLLGPG